MAHKPPASIWTKSDENKLRDLWGTPGVLARDVALALDRSMTSVRRKAQRMGLNAGEKKFPAICLTCGSDFQSGNLRTNRICDGCKATDEFEGASLYDGITLCN